MEIPIFFIFVGIVSFFITGRILGYFGASAYLDKLKPSLWDCIKSSLLGGSIFGGIFLFLGGIAFYRGFESSNLVIKIIMFILAILPFLLGWLRGIYKNKSFFKEERLKNIWP
ncbi:MAG: hypothetical protein IKC10_06240 [Alphaproteobacteria bacterium]|nr:hypothetical protein [Alphaproteobacteria bacterium]